MPCTAQVPVPKARYSLQCQEREEVSHYKQRSVDSENGSPL